MKKNSQRVMVGSADGKGVIIFESLPYVGKLSAESQKEELQKFRRKFHAIIQERGLTAEQVYNCDETLFQVKGPNPPLYEIWRL